jgi:putative DNA primase/helicase
MSALLEAALGYAARGWPVHPVRGKDAPLTPHAVKDASCDPEIIRGWWGRWPDANIAIACGSPGPHVLDIDDPASAKAKELLDQLQAADAPTVASGRGQHQYFAGEDRATIGLTFGELRGRGSYIIAPPSIHPSGREYV